VCQEQEEEAGNLSRKLHIHSKDYTARLVTTAEITQGYHNKKHLYVAIDTVYDPLDLKITFKWSIEN